MECCLTLSNSKANVAHALTLRGIFVPRIRTMCMWSRKPCFIFQGN